MASILVVDDLVINRKFLVSLFGYMGYTVLQAADGAEALALTKAAHPDLVITDVLMPGMDGIEFTRRLRADPAIAGVPVIFYTATYRLTEARQLGATCGVDAIIGKPASPQAILEAVAALLAVKAGAGAAPSVAAPRILDVGLPEWQREGKELPKTTGAERAPMLRTAMQDSHSGADALSLRLAAVIELGVEMAGERDLDRLLNMFVQAAQDIMRSRYSAAGLADSTGRINSLGTRGLPEEVRHALAARPPGGLLADAMAEGKAHRYMGPAVAATTHGLPEGHPPVRALLALPVGIFPRSRGWLYFADKLGAEAFSEEDEQIASTLSTKLSLAAENLILFEEVQNHARELEIEAAVRRESEARFRELAENIREVFWLVDPALSQVFYVSPAYEEVWGRSCASFYAAPGSWCDAVHADDRALLSDALDRMRGSGHLDCEYRVLRPDGSIRWIRARGFPIRNDDGELMRVAGLAEDITQQKEQEARIARLNRIYAVLSDINSAIIRIHERMALFREACRVAVESGRFNLAWIGTVDGTTLKPLAWRRREGHAPPAPVELADTPADAVALRSGKASVCNDLHLDPVRSEGDTARGPRSRALLPLRQDGVTVGAIALYADETEFFDAEEMGLLCELAGDISFALDYIAREERLNYLAYYDALTGLPNRSLFLDRVSQLLHGAARDGTRVALILADIDHFQQINSKLGRHVGDSLLRQVAERLVAAQEEPCSLARLGGDMFAIAVAALPADSDALTGLRRRVLEPLAAPFAAIAGEVVLTARAGIALYPGDGDDADTLLSCAEFALGHAKACGERHLHFDAEQNARNTQKVALESELRQALGEGQFAVYFQPRLSLQSGEIIGAEALIRWLHPERGVLSPAGFIPLAEETGLIVPISEWVLRTVCDQLAAWLEKHVAVVPVAVNLSAMQFRSGNLADLVRDALSGARLDATRLELELTEGMVMQDPDSAVVTLKALRRLGVCIALDDFGTGYSSLAYLKRFPFCSVKIDRAFVTDITRNPEDAAIADAVIAIARRLGMKTVAEGVETDGQMNYLRRQGCDELQGYLFSPAVSHYEFEALLAGGRRLVLPADAPADERTLLLVDSEPNVLAALSGVLRCDGYRVLTAASAEAGLDLLAVNKVQVVVAEQRMAGMSGTEFLGVVKGLYPDTIRIILSGHTDMEAVTHAVNRGAVFKFLTKPWKDEQLRGNISDAFRHYRPTGSD